MTAGEVFLLLDCKGLSIRANGTQLAVQPTTLMTNELRTLVRKHRIGLLALARDGEARAATVVAGARWGNTLHQTGGQA